MTEIFLVRLQKKEKGLTEIITMLIFKNIISWKVFDWDLFSSVSSMDTEHL